MVVVMLMVTTVIIMFGMTVSVGHLVQSKINLQNSVDLSSMSVASYQARYMNSLSVENYRIRAVLKFFLMDAYVTQSRFNYKFGTDIINGSGGDIISSPERTFAVCQQARDFTPVPEVDGPGRKVDDTTNVCYNYGQDTPRIITPLVASPFPGFSPIYIFINQTLLRIAREFENSCGEWRGQNGNWARYAIARLVDDTNAQYEQRSKILSPNADNVPNFFSDLSGQASPRGRAGDAAYATFQSNLIGALATQNRQDNRLLYLNEDADRMVTDADLIKSRRRIGLPYVEPKWSSGCSIEISGNWRNDTREVVQGFSKDPEKIVTVPLLANGVNAQILFWPQGLEPTLVAVAAAKPFGSRIGPPPEYFQREGDGAWGNIALYPGDDARTLRTGGLGHKDILKYVLRSFPNPSSGRPRDRSTNELSAIAYAPTIYDGMYYSIFPSTAPDAPVDILSTLRPPLSIDTFLKDRRKPLPDPYAWGNVQGLDYYKPQSLLSAWSPGPEARSGYQIKLLGFTELCRTSAQSTLQLRELCRIVGRDGTL